MRVFAWEYVTAHGLGKADLPAALRAEGAMMLRALRRDLAAIPGVEPVVAAPGTDGAPPLAPDLLADCAAFWPIAPETDGCLEAATRLARAAGRAVLNSRIEAVAIARSKRATAQQLAQCGIPVVPTTDARDPPPPGPQGWVIKPDDGAGASGTRLVSCRDELDRCREMQPNAVVQPYLPGDALSLSLLVQDGAAWLLSCNRQLIDRHGDRFVFRGSIVAGAEERRPALTPLAEATAAALPGLWGYVGVDLVDAPGGPVILEINPRLTTSYAGLAEATGINPAWQVLSLLDQPLGRLVRRLRTRPVAVTVPQA
jgi:predicted ATP-grasp superfamily ATP-dependent carboligase